MKNMMAETNREQSAYPHGLANLVAQGGFIPWGQGEENRRQLGGDDIHKAHDEKRSGEGSICPGTEYDDNEHRKEEAWSLNREVEPVMPSHEAPLFVQPTELES